MNRKETVGGKIRRIGFVTFFIVCGIWIAGCGKGSRGGDESEIGQVSENGYAEDEIWDNAVFVRKREDGVFRYYYAPQPEAGFEIGYGRDDYDENDVLWLTEAESEAVPVLNANDGDELVFVSHEADDLSKMTFERMLDNGFTVGLAHLGVDDGGHVFVPMKMQNRNEMPVYISKQSDAWKLMELAEKNDVFYLDKIGGVAVSRESLTDGGAVAGLEQGQAYLAEIYAGTFYNEVVLTADRRVMTFLDYFESSEYEFLQGQGVRIEVPEGLESGYYFVNNTGLIQYVAEGDNFAN